MEEKQIPLKIERCKCGSKSGDTTEEHCKNGRCGCVKRKEPCIPPHCLCVGCQNTENPHGYELHPQHKPKQVVLEDEKVVEVHPSLELFEKGHEFGHLVGTTAKDDEPRKLLNERVLKDKAATCPQCARLESTFLTWYVCLDILNVNFANKIQADDYINAIKKSHPRQMLRIKTHK